MASLKNGIYKLKGIIYYRFTFKQFGKNSILCHPLEINNPKHMIIENKVYIAEYAWLMARKGVKDSTKLRICSNTQIGHFSHIVANNSILIEKNVLIADKVFISDCTHDYIDINTPIQSQEIITLKSIIIGESSWIGEGVCICGANIGTHSVIGANSVVTKDIPDYCVAAGAPAKVIKRYNFKTNQWENVSSK